MYKQHLLNNLEREILLLKQISPLIKESDLNFRPAEKVRSMLELLQYLSTIGSSMVRWFVKNDLTKEEWQKIREYRSSLNLQNLHDRLDEQWADIKRYMADVTEEDLVTKIVELPGKEKMQLGSAIINAPVKWLAAYRMEVFVYLKLLGNAEISTREAWILPDAMPA